MKEAGEDLLVAETMINIEETLAAVDATNAVCELPIMCTMTVEADGSIFSGGNAVEAAVALESAGADAVGINCSVGPDQLVSVGSQYPGGCFYSCDCKTECGNAGNLIIRGMRFTACLRRSLPDT